MIRRSVLIAGTAVTLIVAGCSGSDDSSTDPTPTPTASATATASPSPITYSTLPVTAGTAAEFFSVSASTSYTGDLAAGPVTLGAAGTEGYSNRVRFAIQGTLTAATTVEVVVREFEEESRFTGADIATAPAPTTPTYLLRESTAPTTPGAFTELELLNNTVSGQVTTDTALALKHTSYAGWWRGASTAGLKRITYATFGYPTVGTDMPTAGVFTYNARLGGGVVVSPTAGASAAGRLSGTATVSVDYAAGLVTVTMNLTRQTAGGPVSVGTYTGTGAIPVGSNQFTGSFGPGSTLGGTFQGMGFGAKAAEIGISFAVSGTIGGEDVRAVGVIVGKQNAPS